MGYTLTNKTTGEPVKGLMNYNISRDAVPLNPDSSNTAIPTMSFQVATDPAVDTGALMGQLFSLSAQEQNPQSILDGTAVSYSSGEATGVTSIDTETLFARLNTDQTLLPLLTAYDVSRLIKYWAQECGVPVMRIPGTVQNYVSELEVGYARRSQGSWVMLLGLNWRLTTSLGGNYTADPMPVMSGQSILHSYKLLKSTRDTSFTWAYARQDVFTPGEVDPGKITIARVGNNAVCTISTGNTSKTITIALPGAATAAASDGWEMHLLAEVLPGTSTVQYSLRAVPLFFGGTITTGSTTDTVANSFMTKHLGLAYMQGTVRGSVADPLTAGQWASVTKHDKLPDAPLDTNFSDSWGDRVPPAAAAVPGFQGNVWSSIVQVASIHRLNVTLVDGRIRLTPQLRRSTFTGGYDLGQIPFPKGNIQLKQAARTPARKVEVVRHKLDAGVHVLLWKADSVYSIERGETQKFTVQTEGTFQTLEAVTPTAGVTNPSNPTFGQYVVTGADGYIVDPAWWTNNGGSLKVSPTGTSGEIEITIQAPGIVTVRAPYRISEGAADRPALYIFGRGITSKPETLQFYTSAPESAQEIGATFDSPFVTTATIANDVGFLLSMHHGGSTSEVSLTTPVDTGQEYSTKLQGRPLWNEPEGRYFYYKGAIYRSKSTSESPQDIQMDSENSTLVAFSNEYWAGKTITDFDNYHAGKLVRDVNRSPLPMYLS